MSDARGRRTGRVSRLAAGISLGTILLIGSTTAQDILGGLVPGSPDSLSAGNRIALSSDKLLNTYHWGGRASYRNFFGPLSLQFNEQFRSSMILIDPKLITDEQSMDFALTQRLTSGLRAAVKFSAFSLSDNKNIGISNASSQNLYGGVMSEPVAGVRIEPMAGVRFDNQIDQHDRGPSYLLNIDTDPLDYNGYMTTFDGMWQYDRLTPRALETRNASATIERHFSGQTGNTLQLLYTRNRRDFYTAADPFVQQLNGVSKNIETRTEDAFTLFDSLDYDAGQGARISLQGDLYTRTIGRETRYRQTSDPLRPLLNTSIDELKLESSAQLAVSPWKNIRGIVRLAYQERDEKHATIPDPSGSQTNFDLQEKTERLKNNHSRRTSLSSVLAARISPSDSLAISGSGSLLRYDTPSADNNDDRDELWYILNLATVHRLNPALEFRMLANVTLVHLVYLPSMTSGNNTWNRVFRLAPRVEYRPSAGFVTANTFEVLANYTVYDFEYPSSAIRSFVFRQFGLNDSSTWNVTRRIALEWFQYVKLYEQGELQWESFAERPVNYFEENTYQGSVRYEVPEKGLLFSVGLRYFSQRRYAYSGDVRTLDRFLRSLGPTTTVGWRFRERTTLGVQGWYEQQTQTGVPNRSIANVTLSLVVHL